VNNVEKKKKEYGIASKGIVIAVYTWKLHRLASEQKKAGIKGCESMKDVKGGKIPRALIINKSFRIVRKVVGGHVIMRSGHEPVRVRVYVAGVVAVGSEAGATTTGPGAPGVSTGIMDAAGLGGLISLRPLAL
jgi:hypothetical protein